MQKHGVTDVVRVCEPTYSRASVLNNGIKLHDWSFPDGESPPEQVIQEWLNLVQERFFDSEDNSEDLDLENTPEKRKEAYIAVHCVAGLGRYIQKTILLIFH